MSGVFGGTKKTTQNQQTQSNTALDTDSTSSSFTDALTSALSQGLSSSLSSMFGGSQATGTNTGSTASTSTRNPWADARGSLLSALGGLEGANAAALPGLQAARQSGLDYATAAFGGLPGFTSGDIGQTIASIMGGGGVGAAAGSGGSAASALERMLSGTPDYSGLQGAIDAANAPILRQLNEDIIPGLNSRATFLNNSTGGIKTLNRVLPEVGARMGENAAALTNAERLRALNDQQTGLGLYGNLLSQGTGAALSAAGMAPNILQMGLLPSQLQEGVAGLPLSLAQNFASSVLPFASVGGSDSTAGTTTGTSTQNATQQQQQASQTQNFQASLQQAIQQMLQESESSSTGTESSTMTGTSKTKSGGLGNVLGGLLSLASLIPTGGLSALGGLGGGLLGGAGAGMLGGSIIPGTRAV